MKTILKTLAFGAGLVTLLAQAANAQKQLSDVAPYPEAQAGQVRQVIYLPQLENENDAKVELQIGKTIEVDCNKHSFGGSLESQTLQGWGYDYYVLDELKGPMGTMMACLPDFKPEQAFVTINNLPLMRYNSKLPIVVYVPEGVEVKYRVWKAGNEQLDAQKQ